VDSETCEDFGDYGGDMLYEEEGPPLYDHLDQVSAYLQKMLLLTLIRMTKDEKGLAFFKGLLL
jgi:hypothetical protein